MSITVGDCVLWLRAKNDKLPGDLKQSEGEVKGWAGRMKEQVQGAMSTAAGQLMATGFQQISGAVQNLATDILNTSTTYIREVEEMARATGMASEDTSRLMQVADDYRVSTADLTMAVRTYSKTQKDAGNNSQISLDTIASLSDEYLRLAPGVQRNNFLMEKFGRSGLSMALMMEQGGESIRKMSGEVDSSLVVTQEAIKAQREYELAMDDFEDSLTGVKIELAKALLPVLKDLVVMLKESIIPGLKAAAQWFTNLPAPARQTIIAIGGLIVALTSLMPAIMAVMGLIQMLAGAGGIAGLGAAIGGIGPAIMGVISVLSGPIGLLIAAVGLLVYTIQTLGPAAWESILTLGKIFEALPKLIDVKLQEVAGSIDATTQRWLKAGQDWMNGVKTGMANGWNGVVEYIRGIPSRIGSTFANVGKWFETVGKSIVTGIGNGIKNAWSWLTTTVQNLAKNLLAAAKKALGIKSPSQIFADQVGKNIALGIDQGITDNIGTVTANMRGGLVGMASSVGSGGGVRVGHIEYHGSFSSDELARLDRRNKTILRNTLTEALV
jgi:hypothetical protein